MTITEFLEARITEDEERAQRVRRYGLDGGGGFFGAGRVLAECAAKRAIVALAAEASMIDDSLSIEVGTTTRDEVSEPYVGDRILRTLAAVYADHPDYRQEWAL